MTPPSPSTVTPLGHTQQGMTVRPDTPSTSKKMDGWAQGCQAIFAGFVVVAEEHNLRPNITDFWKTPQRDMILPTLRQIHSRQEVYESKNDETEDDERVYMLALKDILLRDDNKYTQPVTHPSDARVPDGVDNIQANDSLGIGWELTRRGGALFGDRKGNESGKGGGGLSPGGSVPKWWNM